MGVTSEPKEPVGARRFDSVGAAKAPFGQLVYGIADVRHSNAVMSQSTNFSCRSIATSLLATSSKVSAMTSGAIVVSG